MERQTTITRWADRVIEAGWLLAAVFTPYFFSLLTARHFEPDKAMALRSIVLVMLAAWAIKTIERATMLRERINWRAWWRTPLAIPALVFAGVFLLATIASVRPTVSWWGSYQRGQGTYTNLSYMALFALIIGNLRTRDQLQRLITTSILTGVSVAFYGMVQHLGLDPLPWKGDVIARISSTLGNSIFAAAYLIMIVPLVLYRLVISIATFRAAPDTQRTADGSWIGFTALLVLGQQAFLLGILKFMAAVRPLTGDFRYWWVFPIGLAVIAGTFALISLRTTQQPSRTLISTLLGGLGVWTLVLAIQVAASSGAQSVDGETAVLRDWWIWLLIGVVAVGGTLIAMFFLPRRSAESTRTLALGQIAGYGAALVLILLAIFFSQSRGPWIGGIVGIGLFVVLLLLRLIRTAQREAWPSLPRLRTALWSVLGLGVVLAGLLIVFNVSRAPVFESLRSVPYVGRLGRLLETEDGTGRVRTLIWFGDDKGGGAVGLLESNWLRTLTFGHGPETMFTAYNPFYPPELARYEQRGASPDRSHQAWLDELVTKGALGLLSYFFLFGSAAALAWQQIRRSATLDVQVLSIAALSTIAAHFVEVLVGIPIVATLTMLWITFGMLVMAARLESQAIENADSAPVESMAATPERRNRTQRGRGGAARGGNRPVVTSTARGGLGYRWSYALLLALAIVGVWSWNLRNNYADMFLNQAQSFSPRNISEEAFAYQKLLRAVEVDPSEDYYYLQLGNALLRIATPYKLAAQQATDASTAPRPDQKVEDLFEPRGGETERVVWLIQNNSVEQILEYTRLVLERAYQINPTNKDHPANLGRLNLLWARRVNGGPARIQQAIEWFEDARRIAPNDANILNELASAQALAGNTAEAERLFKESIDLDPRYAETYARLGELYRANKRLPEAAQQFAAAVGVNRSILESDTRQLAPVLVSLAADRQALQTLRDAFEQQKQRYDQQLQTAEAEGRAPPVDARFLSQLGRVRAAAADPEGTRAAFDELLQIDPSNVTYRQQYTAALSDTQQYDAALDQAQQALKLAQDQQADQAVADLQKMIDVITPKAGG